jgi:hypothetical protein
MTTTNHFEKGRTEFDMILSGNEFLKRAEACYMLERVIKHMTQPLLNGKRPDAVAQKAFLCEYFTKSLAIAINDVEAARAAVAAEMAQYIAQAFVS